MIISHYSGNYCIIKDGCKNGGFAKLTNLPGYKRWQGRDLIFRPAANAIQFINENFGDVHWEESAKPFLDEYIRVAKQAELNKNNKTGNIDFSMDGHLYKRPPMDHQRKAFMISRDQQEFGLFMEQGTGKTKVIIDTAAYLYGKGEIDCFVIIAWPNGVHRNWIDTELDEDMPNWCPYKACWYSSNLTKAKKKEIEDVYNFDKGLRIISFNAEAFVSDKAKELIYKFVHDFRTLLVLDQSACIKNPTAKRTKFLADKIAPMAKFRRILDGQPVAEGGEELYSQFKFLNPMIIGCDTWTAFKAEYCKIGFFNEVVGYKNMDKLYDKIDGYSYRVLEKDCLDLPKRIYKKWHFDLSDKESAIYEDLRKTSIAEFEGETLAEQLPLVKNMRLQQVARGWWVQRDEASGKIVTKTRTIEEVPSALKALDEVLATYTGKAIIFSRYRADLELLKKHLGDKAVTYYGGMSDDDKHNAKVQFQTNPDILYFIGQPRTAGIGHTLTAAKNVIFYSNDTSLRFREESEKRAHRKGQTERVHVIDLIANGTVDKKTVNALRSKKELSEFILRDPESFFMKEE